MKLLENPEMRGSFGDLFTARRAERVVMQSLQEYFLLRPKHDYDIRREESPEGDGLRVVVVFKSASSRYAIWRIVNGQAPHFKDTLVGDWRCVVAESLPPEPEPTEPEPKRAA